ncbi:GNAT family N-acetyltransferase [Paenarthrobacter sp. NPDC089714]|uniref:GNAT family N-acetyltransferase n=1 Tax=Paenarthrobacter sp. NPDC089714 TaxID=3364377 RepID=UPI003802B0D2
MPSIRRLRPEDWPLLKAVRLEMLADTPMAYVESLQAARRQTDTQWLERASAMSAEDSVTLVADEDGPGSRIRALMRVVVKHPQDPGRPLQGMLISVYVAPEYRGLGLADQMLAHACQAAVADLGAWSLELGVHQDNQRAMAFYKRHGFQLTGESKPYPLDPNKQELFMEKQLASAVAGDAAVEVAGTD